MLSSVSLPQYRMRDIQFKHIMDADVYFKTSSEECITYTFCEKCNKNKE